MPIGPPMSTPACRRPAPVRQDVGMGQIKRFDHVGITVADLDVVTDFFVGLGLDRLAADGYGLVGEIGQHENVWRMAYVRGPEGIIVSLAERIG